MQKTVVEKHFDKVAENYDFYKKKNSFYYDNLKKLLRSLIPINKNVFEFGCGTGDLLASLNPTSGVGYDLSPEMIKIAKQKYKSKNLKFWTKFPILKSSIVNHKQSLASKAGKSFDVIFMSDVIEHLDDPQKEFNKIASLMNKNSIFVITMANPIWEPILMIWEKMGLKMKEGPHFRIKNYELGIMMKKTGLKIIKHDFKLLVPIKIPFITNFANKYLEKYLKPLCFIEYLVLVKT